MAQQQSQQSGQPKWPQPVADMIALVPDEFNDWLTENPFDLEAVIRAFHNCRNIFSQAFAMDKETWRFIPQVVAKNVAKNVVADDINFPGIADVSDDAVTRLYEIFAEAQKRKAQKVREEAEAAEQKKAEAAAEKEQVTKGKSKTPENRRKVLAAAEETIRQCKYPVIAERLEALLRGRPATDTEGAQAGFFDALAGAFEREEVDSFYDSLGAGTPDQIKSILADLVALRDISAMLDALEGRNLITPKE